MKAAKKWIFNKMTTIFVVILFVLLNTFSFLAEWLVGKIDVDTEKWFRLISIVCDVLIIIFGILAWFQIRFRKVFKRYLRIHPEHKKQIFWIGIIADALASVVVVYSLYLIRLIWFYHLDKITLESVFINGFLGFLTAVLFGFVNYAIRKFKKNLRKTTPVSGGSFFCKKYVLF